MTAYNGWNFKGSPYVGIDAVWDYVFMNAGADFDPTTYKVVIDDIVDLGPDHVLVMIHYTGNSVQTGEFKTVQTGHLWTLKEGRIKKFTQYTDTFKMQHFNESDA